MRARLNQEFVDGAKPAAGAERTIWWDEGLASFGLMVTAAGHKSYVVQYRAGGRSRRYTIRANQTFKAAKAEAKAILGKIAKGADPVFEKRRAKLEAANTLRSIAETYLQREERKGELRSIGERRRIFAKYLFPRLGSRQIDAVKRSEIVRLLDRIEDESGAPMADHVLAALRRVMNWHASRSDDFRSPITRGMAKTKLKERERQRTLSDDELRTVWRAAETFPGPYGYLLRFILLTATRLREAARMHSGEITGDEWLIPAKRHKSKREFLLPLSRAAQGALKAIPIIGTDGWVFTTSGKKPIGGFSKFKRQFDAHVLALLRKEDAEAKPLPRWTPHDLRRTARSLMSRARVDPDHAERALGHVIPGIRGVYDRHEFEAEKLAAFEALAGQITRILDPEPNMRRLRAG